MTVTVKFSCGGCPAEADGTAFLQRRFHAFSGRGHGLGYHSFDTVMDVVPEGWIAFDPYTGACYCPTCWADIEAPNE